MRTSFSILTAMVVSTASSKNIEGAQLSVTSGTDTKEFSCQPNITYVHDFKTCVCTNNGQWPKNCTTIPKVYNDKVLRSKCKKSSYVTVHCNICKCNDNGQIDYQKCTKHACESGDEPPKSRKFSKSINGKCNPKIWYSFAPCQLCYCINDNKLICNSVNDKLNRLVLGAYNFTVCGDMFLKDTIDLMPNADQILRLGIINTESQPVNIIDNIKEAQPPREDKSNNINQSDTDESNETLNSVRGRVNKKKIDSNSAGADEEDRINNVDSRTQMPEYEKPESGEVFEHINKQKSEESDSEEMDVTTKSEPSVFLSNQVEVINEAASPNTFFEYKSDPAYKNSKNNVPMFNLNLPNILKNLINIGFRRAHVRKMVSLDSGSSCEPGTQMTVKCNTCFCMRNGKLLCTMKLCLEKFEENI